MANPSDPVETAAHVAEVVIAVVAVSPFMHRALYLLRTAPREADTVKAADREFKMRIEGRFGPIQLAWMWFVRKCRTYRDETLTWRERWYRSMMCHLLGHDFGKREVLIARKRDETVGTEEREPMTPAEMLKRDEDAKASELVTATCSACHLSVAETAARIDQIAHNGEEPWRAGSRRTRYRDSPESMLYELEALKQRVEAMRRDS